MTQIKTMFSGSFFLSWKHLNMTLLHFCVSYLKKNPLIFAITLTQTDSEGTCESLSLSSFVQLNLNLKSYNTMMG